MIRALRTLLAAAFLALPASAWAQYGYGYGMPYDPVGAAIEQQMAQLQQQIDAQVLELMRPFIQYYRDRTGDMQTPDAMAGQYGQQLWCQDYPVECQRAMTTTDPQAQAWMEQSQRAHQQRMAQNQASFDAYMTGLQESSAARDAQFDAWMAGQESSYRSHQDYVQGAIHGEADYTDPTTGQTMSLPYAPDPNWSYQTPAGNPLWFDATTNTWYEVAPNGFYTPYYGQ